MANQTTTEKRQLSKVKADIIMEKTWHQLVIVSPYVKAFSSSNPATFLSFLKRAQRNW